MTPAVTINQVSFHYPGQEPILDNISLTIAPGEFLGVIGPNGSGKSTLLRLMLGLLVPTAGTVRMLGADPQHARPKIGYVPQQATYVRNFPISVIDVVMAGRLGRTSAVGRYSQLDRQLAMNALDRLQVANLSERALGTLSGGQQQRVMIARALVSDPELLMMDEPTSNIDPHGGGCVMDLLHEVHGDKTIVVVSHDLGFVSSHVKRVACLNLTLECHTIAELSPEALRHLYGTHVHAVMHEHH